MRKKKTYPRTHKQCFRSSNRDTVRQLTPSRSSGPHYIHPPVQSCNNMETTLILTIKHNFRYLTDPTDCCFGDIQLLIDFVPSLNLTLCHPEISAQ